MYVRNVPLSWKKDGFFVCVKDINNFENPLLGGLILIWLKKIGKSFFL